MVYLDFVRAQLIKSKALAFRPGYSQCVDVILIPLCSFQAMPHSQLILTSTRRCFMAWSRSELASCKKAAGG